MGFSFFFFEEVGVYWEMESGTHPGQGEGVVSRVSYIAWLQGCSFSIGRV